VWRWGGGAGKWGRRRYDRTPVVTLVKVHPLRLRLSIPEREASSVRLGLAVRVRLEGDTTTHPGRIARISPAIEESSRTLSIESEVANPTGTLRPAAFANAEVVTESTEDTILVPETALASLLASTRPMSCPRGRPANGAERLDAPSRSS